VRENIVFPELSDAEKLVVAEQSQLLLEGVYVHRFQKQDFYPGVTDPVPAVQAVIDNIDNLTVAEMEAELYRIFSSQRDLHLNYIFPQPYSTFQSFLPLTFKRVQSRRNFFNVRVDTTNAERFALFAPDQRVPEVGDEVVAFNGVRIRRAVNNLVEVGQGANEAFAPQGTASRAASSATAKQKVNLREMDIREDLFQKLFNDFRKQNDLVAESVYPSNPSNEPEITWGIIENRSGNFGYIRLASFVPDNGVDFAVQEIRRIIYDEFDGTRGMIFDVRDNGGGGNVANI